MKSTCINDSIQTNQLSTNDIFGISDVPQTNNTTNKSLMLLATDNC